MKRSSIYLSLILSLTACGPSLPRAPMRVHEDTTFSAPVAVTLPGVPDEPAAPFTLLPGDVISFRTIGAEPMEAQRLTVDAAGRIHIPLIGDVQVSGQTLSQAESLIETALRQFERFARVAVTVVEATGHHATVVGSVAHPGIVPIPAETRLSDLVGLAGGTRTAQTENEDLDLADLEGARLIRDGAALPVSLARALQGDPRHNVRVRANDLLYVPSARGQRVSVLGVVRQPRSLVFRRGMRLTEALALAGGTSERSNESDVRVVRGPLSNPRVYTASLSALVDGTGHDVELEPGDVLYVGPHWFFGTVGDTIQRIAPLLAAFTWTAAAVAR